MCSGSNGGSFCKLGITADLFGAICTTFFLSLKFTYFMIISRSLVKGFLTKVKISTQNHQSAQKFKYEASTSHESKASQLTQKDPPLFPLHKKIRHYSHFTKRFAIIAQGCRKDPAVWSFIPLTRDRVQVTWAVCDSLCLNRLSTL